MPEPLLPPRSMEVSDVMDAAKRVFLATLAKGLPLAMFGVLCSQLAAMYWLTTGKSLAFTEPRDTTFWALALVGLAGYQLLAGALMVRQRKIVAGVKPELAAEFSAAFGRWPALMVTGLLAGASFFLGTLLLLLPGIFVLVCTLLQRPVVLFEKVDPVQALKRCVQLVRPHFWKVMAVGVIALLIAVVCLLGAGALLGLVNALLGLLGVQAAVLNAFGVACMLGFEAVAIVYFSAVWLALYSAASSSA